ncbi:hypothetical protein GCM10010520_11610 [Rhizobium viscosum]|uniref:Transcriptional regulator n=1 Tax=Rhizobium viscosum TaxID=1673 RepID=A0ABR9IYJ7_RHIVS|nr:hypothetical protein [Rhizobium viscosum]MBE1508294.1 hypothetical protein [Rhizobium viscosum]
MSITESDRILFNRVWALGTKAVKDKRIAALSDVACGTPTLQEYQNSHGQRMTDLVKVVQLGLSQLRDSGECEETQSPPSHAFAPARPLIW